MISDQERRISCQLQGDTLVIDLSYEDDPNVLFLDIEEAEDLLAHLQNDVIGSMVCEQFGDPPVESFDVAGTTLSSEEAWRLHGCMEDILRPDPEPDDLDAEDFDDPDVDGFRGDLHLARVNWKIEGF